MGFTCPRPTEVDKNSRESLKLFPLLGKPRLEKDTVRPAPQIPDISVNILKNQERLSDQNMELL